jgi:hypothetical protein
MIVCPNCKHNNPDGAINCEACYTALPASQMCPNCGASVQVDATFCGQCGHSLKSASAAAPVAAPVAELPPTVLAPSNAATPEMPETQVLTPAAVSPVPVTAPILPVNQPVVEPVETAEVSQALDIPDLTVEPIAEPVVEPVATPDAVTLTPSQAEATPSVAPIVSTTQLQQSTYKLLHLQTNTEIEISPHLTLLHIGKPNDRIPPDIDVSGYPCSEVVSRVHADIRIEDNNHYIEDIGSANGTYINHNILPKGNRHLLRIGDRISLGKGDLVTFIFQSSSVG